MTDCDLDLRLLTARAVAREAGKLALDYFNRRAQLQGRQRRRYRWQW